MSNILYLIILVAIVALVAIIQRIMKRQAVPLTFPYHTKESLLSPAERSFLGVLDQALVNDNYRTFAQVRLADIVEVDKGLQRSDWQKAFNAISRKHVDFVVCRSDDMAIAGAIELDDRSHQKRTRKDRDQKVDEILAAAGIPLVRVKTAVAYAPIDIKNLLVNEINLGIQAESARLSQESVSAEVNGDRSSEDAVAVSLPNKQSAEPICPKCGSPLVPRVSKKGKHQGEKFWGCSNFPNCRYIAKRE